MMLNGNAMLQHFSFENGFIAQASLWFLIGLLFTFRKAICIKSIYFNIFLLSVISIPFIMRAIGNTIETGLVDGLFPILIVLPLIILTLMILKSKPQGDLVIFNINRSELFECICIFLSGNGIIFEESGNDIRFSDSESRIRIEYNVFLKCATISFSGFKNASDTGSLIHGIKQILVKESKLGFFSHGLILIILSLIAFAIVFTSQIQ